MNFAVSPYLGMYNNNSAPGIILRIPTFTVSKAHIPLKTAFASATQRK